MAAAARAHILQVAGELFFRYGYRAVGIDAIIAESGVAKATLYRHFASKDDLIVAYLQEMNTAFWNWFDRAAEQWLHDPQQQLLAVFTALQTLVTSPTCYGCPFLIAATEFPDPTHPGHRIALDHKQALRSRLFDLCQQLKVQDAQVLADQLYLLMDSAFVAVRVFGTDNPAARVGEFARLLLACALA
jgi:AcrR family transcriptional regulator